VAGKRGRKSGIVHDHHGNSQGHVPAVPPGQANTEDSSGQVRGKRRLHEPGSAEGNPRTSRWRRHFSAAAVRRREPHWSQFTFLQKFLPNINVPIYIIYYDIYIYGVIHLT